MQSNHLHVVRRLPLAPLPKLPRPPGPPLSLTLQRIQQIPTRRRVQPAPGHNISATVSLERQLRSQAGPQLRVGTHARPVQQRGRQKLHPRRVPQQVSRQVARVLREAEDAVRRTAGDGCGACQLRGEEPVARLRGDVVLRLVGRRRGDVGHGGAAGGRGEVDDLRAGPDDAHAARSAALLLHGGVEGGEEQLGDEEGAEAVGGEL